MLNKNSLCKFLLVPAVVALSFIGASNFSSSAKADSVNNDLDITGF